MNWNLTSATFENTNGRYVSDTGGANTDLLNILTAATYLNTNYSNKYWTR